MTERNPRGAGRKRKPEGDKLVPVTIYVSETQKAFIKAAGGSEFVRNLIELVRKGKSA